LGLLEFNTGNFSFVCNEKRKGKNALNATVGSLDDGLPNYLNFNKEKTKLRSLSKKIDSIVIFSNHKGSALTLLMRSAFKDPLFPGFKTCKIVEEITLNHSQNMNEKVINFFHLSIGIKAPSEERLIKMISSKLEIKNHYIGILLIEENRENKNFEFIKELIRIVTKTHAFRTQFIG